jgi:CubicO group peptidase (beta-lactamase class C family)
MWRGLRRRVLGVGLAVALATACSAPAEAPATPTVGARMADAVAAQLGGEQRQRYADVRAVVVLVRGEVVFEHYYGGGSPEQHRDVHSVTKSVVSTLIGIAVGEGRLRLDQNLAELLPKYAGSMSPDMARTTLRQLLTMTAGFPDDLHAEDLSYTSTPDWVRTILGQAERPPGGLFTYSNRSAHLLSAVLVQATGRPVLDYARERLFDPLDIVTRPAFEPAFGPATEAAFAAAAFAWPVDPQGRHTGAGWLRLRPLEMARIGQLFLDGGRWDGRQVVPADWVRAATTQQVDSTAMGIAGGYGYQWWVADAGGEARFYAQGIGGQRIEVVPRLGLVVVIASEFDASHRGVDGSYLDLLARGVIAPVLR